MRYIPVIWISLLAFTVVPCPAQENRVPPEGAQGSVTTLKQSPLAKTFEEYWRRSRAGDWAAVDKLIAVPPESYFTCYSVDASECRERLIAKAQEEKKAGTRSLALPRHDSLIRKNIPHGIHNRFWESYTVKAETTFENEGRLQVSIKIGNGYLLRDFLLNKATSSWKVIDVVDPGDIEHYAAKR